MVTTAAWTDTAPPVRVRLAFAAGFLLVATRVALSVPCVVGAYSTVTWHGWVGSTVAPAQLSAVFVNAAAPVSVTVTPMTLPFELVSVNVCEAVSPAVTSS